MSELPPPILVVSGGGREPDLVQPIGYEDDGTPIYAQPPAEGNTIPGSCLRVLHGPRTVDCPHLCPGRQEDGGCLVDIVRLANDNGVEWSFTVIVTDRGPLWVYDGPPLD